MDADTQPARARPDSSARRHSGTLHFLFFLTGLCGLGYQLAWTRMLSLGLGHEYPAVLAVVTSFFGGLAFGAAALARRIESSPRPLRWYVGIEIVIGAWAVISILLIPWANDWIRQWIGENPSPQRHGAVALALPFLLLLVATGAMGASLPAMVRLVAPLSRTGRCVGSLYAANTSGAIAGIVGTVFLLTPLLGHSFTLLVLGTINFVCAGTACLVLKRSRTESATVDPADSTAVRQNSRGSRSPGTTDPIPRRVSALFLTGFLGIGYEIIGVRALAQSLENTIYTFATILSVYLAGTAIGAGLYHRFYSGRIGAREPNAASLINRLLAGLALSCLAGGWILGAGDSLYAIARAVAGDGVFTVSVAESLPAAAAFLIPTILMGATFSHLAETTPRIHGGLGRAVAWNTAGSAAAPVVFGLVILPSLGLKGGLIALVTGYIALNRPVNRSERIRWIAIIAVSIVGLIPLDLRLRPGPGKTVYYREGVLGTVTVVEDAKGERRLALNARFVMGGTAAAAAARRHVHIPLLLHPDPGTALILGVGTGISFGAAASHENLDATGVELVPEILDALPWFSPQNALTEFPKSAFVAADARRFVSVTDQKFDVIIADLFHPGRDGAATLFTREHFAAIKSRLRKGGLFCQWLPVFQLDSIGFRIIAATFLDEFPTGRAILLRLNIDTPVVGLIGWADGFPGPYGIDGFDRRTADPDLANALNPLRLDRAHDLFGLFLAGPDTLRAYVSGAERNTDDRSALMFHAPRHTIKRGESSHRLLMDLVQSSASGAGEFVVSKGGDEFAGQVQSYMDARDLYLRGLVVESEEGADAAVALYVESTRTSAAFTLSYARCLILATQWARTDPEGARRLLNDLIDARPEEPVALRLLRRLFPDPHSPPRG